MIEVFSSSFFSSIVSVGLTSFARFTDPSFSSIILIKTSFNEIPSKVILDLLIDFIASKSTENFLKETDVHII
jgi:hypothetical protein